MNTRKEIGIVGSGLAGSLLAIVMAKQGYKVTVFDRRSDIRNIKFSGRSINLAMSTRGWKALDNAGIKERIQKIAIPMYHRSIHLVEKPSYNQAYGKENEAIYSISRGTLNKEMISIAQEQGVCFKFNEKVWDIDLPNATLYTGDEEKSSWKASKFDLIFGCDGAFSRVRHRMQRRSRFDYSQKFLSSGYKELSIPAKEDGTHILDPNGLHIWPRGKFMLIALPNLDGSFTCTLFLPHEGNPSFESLESNSDILNFWKKYFPDTLDIMPNLLEDFKNNPVSALVTMKCYPWTYWNKVALVGDAAHAIVPFYGQGINAGFEDITQLDNLITQYGDKDWEKIFKEYQRKRKPNADAIAKLSYMNFMEMSQDTADPMFILRKKIEEKFSQKHPDLWKPLYSRVTFSHQPYSEALAMGLEQRAIMDKIMKLENIDKIWDTDLVIDKIHQEISQYDIQILKS